MEGCCQVKENKRYNAHVECSLPIDGSIGHQPLASWKERFDHVVAEVLAD